MWLNKLFKDAPEVEVLNIMTNSKEVLDKALFFCLKGNLHDGHEYVNQAIRNGAIVVVYMDDLKEYNNDIVYIKVKNTTKSLISTTTKFYNDPSKEMKIFGITGTNGKTSVASLIRSINGNYHNTGYIGTLGIRYNDYQSEANLTTPDVNRMNQVLRNMVDEKVEACAIEVSSIGIEQHRVANIDIDYAIFTNFTHDHLDYHGTMENYFNAKKMMFDALSNNSVAIVNIDDQYASAIIEGSEASIITYGIESTADYQAKDLQLLKDRSIFTLVMYNTEYRVETNLVARFNIYNLLAAIAALHASGLHIDSIIANLKNLHQIDGRMEIIDEGQPFNVIVDFAHTPDGIEKVMQYATTITPKTSRIIVVIGSAGKRDIKKRKVFGELIDKYCDMAILTADDPRGESVIGIADQIAEGIINKNYIIVEDRYNAIRQAIELVNSNDTVLILGKGNETFMYEEFGKQAYQGDDSIARETILKYYIEKGESYDEFE